MEWKEACGGFARRMALEDGTPVIAVLKDADGQRHVSFWSDVDEFDKVELESGRLGGLSDLIDVLRPEDIIDICCRTTASSRGGRTANDA